MRLLGLVPVPATVTAKRPGRSWSWRVGAVDMTHRVDPAAGGCDVVVELSAPAAVEALLRATYGPAVSLLVRNLAARRGRTGGDHGELTLRGQAAAATTGARRSSATAYATRDPIPIALATERECAVAASPAA